VWCALNVYRIADGQVVVAVAAAAVGVVVVAGRAAVEATAARSKVPGRADMGLDSSSGVAEHLVTVDRLGLDRAGRSRATSSRSKPPGDRFASFTDAPLNFYVFLARDVMLMLRCHCPSVYDGSALAHYS